MKIFLLCWIAVALVPLWRLRAVRQWQNPQLIARIGFPDRDAVAPPLTLGLTPQNARKGASQFPDDAAVQLTELSQPNLGFSNSQAASSSEGFWREHSESYFSRFAALSRRFPGDLAIRSQWLRDATQGALNIESAGLAATYGKNAELNRAQTWMSPGQIDAALGCAREGAKGEPDNAFWPWMEAMFQFSQRRDDLALGALERAGQCPRFSDGTLETVRRRIDLMRRVQLADTEDGFWEAWSVTFPHYSRMRAATRQVMWLANQSLKKGDTARALEIAGIMQRAALPVARAKDSLIEGLIGEALAYIAWGQTLKNAGFERPVFPYESGEEIARSKREFAVRFAAYARRNGREDLAREALQIQASFKGLELREALNNPQINDVSRETERLARLHWLGAWLLQMAVCAALIWGFLALISRFRLDASPQTRRQMAIWSAFCGGATVAVSVAALRFGVFGIAVNDVEESVARAHTFMAALPLVLAALWLAPGVSGVVGAVARQLRGRTGAAWQVRGFHWRSVMESLIYSALIGSSLWFALAYNARQGSVVAQFGDAALVCCLAAFATTTLYQIARARDRMATGLLWAAFWIALGTLRVAPGLGDGFYGLIGGFLALMCLLLGLSAHRHGWRQKMAGFWTVWDEFATRTRLAAATLALASTLAYFALNFAAIPLRQSAQATLDRHLQIGEVALIEERLAERSK